MTDDPCFTVRPVGVVHSPHQVHHDAPRQPAGAPGRIEVSHGYQNLLADLAGFSHLWILFWCHHARGWNDRVVPPRDTQARGLFATRAPHRPNPVGLSVVPLLRIEKRILHIGGHDVLDGSPVLDIKPYLARYDSVPDATGGWVDALGDTGEDHREWWTEKGIEPPRVYRDRDGDGDPPLS